MQKRELFFLNPARLHIKSVIYTTPALPASPSWGPPSVMMGFGILVQSNGPVSRVGLLCEQ